MRLLRYILAAAVLPLLFTQCFDDAENSSYYEIAMTLKAPEGYKLTDISDLQIKFTNNVDSRETVVAPDGDSFSTELKPGEYYISASGTLTDKETGQQVYIGGSDKARLFSSATGHIDLTITGRPGLIFKEVYFSGCASYYMMDSFYEIYNNSDEPVYLDGIILGIVHTDMTGDSKSPWIVNGELPDRYPMHSYTMFFPGSGTDHVLEPYEGAVLARLPIDHTARGYDPETEDVSVDLSNADWDIYVKTAQDTDIDGVPNMEVARNGTGFYFMPSLSGMPLILARVPDTYGDDLIQWANSAENEAQLEGVSTKYLMIPKDYIIDAIDIVYPTEGKRNKSVLSEHDAGMVWVDGSDEANSKGESGMYSFKSLRRKVVDFTAEGRPIYKDTNNSSEDFIPRGQRPPTPGIHPTVID